MREVPRPARMMKTARHARVSEVMIFWLWVETVWVVMAEIRVLTIHGINKDTPTSKIILMTAMTIDLVYFRA